MSVVAAAVVAPMLNAGCGHSRESAKPVGSSEATAAAGVDEGGRSEAARGGRGNGGVIYLPADERAAMMLYAVDALPPPRAEVAVRVGDGAAKGAPVWWLAPQAAGGAEPDTAGTPEERMRKWLGMEVAWFASPGGAGAAGLGGGGVSMVALPAAAGVTGATITIEGRAQPIRWLAPPSGKFDFAAPGGTMPSENRWLHVALAQAAAHPWTLWRAQLAARGEDIVGTGAGDSVAKRVGSQHAAVWGVALQRLARADREAARRLAVRLGGAVDFGQGVIAPVWTNWPGPLVAGDGLELLLNDLLANDLNDGERVARARAWIQTLPTGAAWVVDDAGLREGGGVKGATGAVTTLMLVNLADVPAAASVTMGGSAAPLEMTTIRPMSAVRVLVNVGRAEAGDGAGGKSGGPARRLEVKVGEWRGQLTVLADAVGARPPGVTIGPLLREINMGQIANGAARGVMPEVGPPIGTEAVGMLLRRSASGSTGAKKSEEWVVYLECLAPAESDAAEDSVRISFGAPGAPTAVWQVPRRGEASLTCGSNVGAGDDAVERSEEPGRWRLWAPVPSAAIEPDGLVRVGVVRMRRLADGSMERTAWPRAMMPWQDAPGRIAVDLNAWGGEAGAGSGVGAVKPAR